MASPQEATILVGKKPTTNYVIATVMQFNQGSKRVTLKARGGAIARAVSAAIMVRDRFLQGQVDIKETRISSDRVQGQGGKDRNVAAIEIVLEKKQ
ncbi:DNA-binding protein [Thermocladium modestius]|uniref:DNA/RNA-binding protein Alba n=1 Tax=Thermocladium modestius TaxID=62609 RepID=A0A830GTP4_9CREN|nr:DNA-binding protein Alba [Thermocladium modestius]GGP20356.1 DNA-binding protein [Thermocladium modestius]